MSGAHGFRGDPLGGEYYETGERTTARRGDANGETRIMGYLEKLFVSEVAQADTASKVAGLLKPPQWVPSHVVTAGAYSITYEYQTEIRFGAALYTVTIAGPMGSAISRQLGKYPVFAPRSPYQERLGWYAFVEWRGDLSGQGSSAINVFDLALGKALTSQVMKSASFIGWRGGTSSEYLVQEHVANRCSDWIACDARTGKKRLLFHGGYEGHISADGRYLIVLHTRVEVFVALIAIESGTVLDLKTAAEFQSYAPKVTGLDTVSFDPQATCLTSMLNWTRTDFQANKVAFEKMITITVSSEAEPRS